MFLQRSGLAMAPQFVVTPWRDTNELLAVRRDLFAADDAGARERAVNKIIAWRARKLELPLLLESTADIVEAKLRDGQQGVPSHALRLVYATAVSRFVTGLLDTQIDLARLSLPSQTTPLFPVSLRETRHRIVHRQLPSLAELKRAANESLDWLWEHYWSHLDALLAPAARAQQLDEREVKERLQGVLKSYVKERKAEIKSRSKHARAADSAVRNWVGIEAARRLKGKTLVHLLVAERNILPVGKKLGSSMEGAYLIWTPFVTALSTIDSLFLQTLTERMFDVLSSPVRDMGSVDQDPAREGMCAWVVRILGPSDRLESRERSRIKLLDSILGLCLMTPTFWTLKLAEELLKDSSVPGRESWLAILEAAKEDGYVEAPVLPDEPASSPDEMEVDDIDTGLPVSESTPETKQICGPQKYAGLWRPKPIGWVPPGWSEDD